MSSVSPVKQFTSFLRSLSSSVPSSSKSVKEHVQRLSIQYLMAINDYSSLLRHAYLCAREMCLLRCAPLAKYAEGIVGFYFQGGRVTEGTQQVQKVFKCQTAILKLTRGEHLTDPLSEWIRLRWRKTARLEKTWHITSRSRCPAN